MRELVVIVGNNVAATTLAKAMREADKDIQIEMFTEESVPYYARPKLIDFVAGSVDEQSIRFYPEEWYEKNRLGLHLNSRVDRIDVANKRILVGQDWHSYDKLVL
ncbi:MAG: NAD(P)/FAD-dependent oxidoreductase, partial [Thermoplasmata archaeon]